MTVDPSTRTATYIAAENRGDTETLPQCKTRCVCETVIW